MKLDKKDSNLKIRVTQQEREALSAYAAKRKITLSEAIRRALNLLQNQEDE